MATIFPSYICYHDSAISQSTLHLNVDEVIGYMNIMVSSR